MSVDFVKIEKALNIELPEFYKKALLNYPFKPMDHFDCVEDNLIRDIEWIIENNLELRKESFFGATWPEHLLAIGHDGFGNYYFICLLNNDEAIYFADHEEEFTSQDLSEHEFCDDMEEYIQLCKEEQDDVNNNA